MVGITRTRTRVSRLAICSWISPLVSDMGLFKWTKHSAALLCIMYYCYLIIWSDLIYSERSLNIQSPWQHRKRWHVLMIETFFRTGSKRLANPHHGKTSMIFPGIWKLLQRVHFSLFQSCSTPKQPHEERQQIWMDDWMSRSIWHLETTIHWGTSTINAWSVKTIPNQIGRIKNGNRSCTYSIGFEWRLTPCSVHVENIHRYWKEIWDIWQGTLWNHLSLERIETLLPRIWTHHHCIFWSQKLDILQNNPQTEQQTSQMVTLSLGIWHQIDTPTRIKNDSIQCTNTMTTSWNWRTIGRRRSNRVTRNMFINLLDTNSQERILNRKKLDIDVKNAMKILLQEESTSLKNDLEDWKIEEVDGKKMIFYKGKNYIPKDQELQWDVVKMYHDHETAGHLGELGTYNSIWQHYWWPGPQMFVKNYVQGCGTCHSHILPHQISIYSGSKNCPNVCMFFKDVYSMDDWDSQ